MNVFEIRRRRLRLLIDTNYEGVTKRCAEALGLPPPQLHRWLSVTTSSPRRIEEESARAIETKLALPERWLDDERMPFSTMAGSALSSTQQQDSFTATAQQSSAPDSHQPQIAHTNQTPASYTVNATALLREATELIALWVSLSPAQQIKISQLIRRAASSDTVHSALVTPTADPPEQIHQDASHPPGNIEVLPGRPAARPGRKKTAGKPAAGE